MNIFRKALNRFRNSDSGIRFEDGTSLNDFLNSWGNAVSMKVSPESAMRSSSVYSSVRLIAGSMASCPILIYEEDGNGNKSVVKDHYLQTLLQVEPWSRMTMATMMETAVWQMLLKGNAYILIHRNMNGKVLSLELLGENCVGIQKVDGRLRYGVIGDDDRYKVYDQDDILHLPSPFWGRGKNCAFSFLHWTAMVIGLNLSALDNAASFYEKGARVGGVIQSDKKVSPEAQLALRKHYQEMQVGEENKFKPLVLSEGMKFTPTLMTAQDQMIVEQLRFSVEDIARIFGVPPQLLGQQDKSSSQPGSMESMSRNFVTYCFNHHLQRFEQEFTRKLFRTNRKKLSIEFSVEGLLRGDHKTRGEFHTKALGSLTQPGWMSVNEVRKKENLPPKAGEDELIKPSKKEDEKGNDDAK